MMWLKLIHEETEDDIQKLGGLFVNDFYKGALILPHRDLFGLD